MQKPFFSIIVVSLNPGERLEKTLNSILSQTYQNYEVILKDGGSKDGSLEFLKEKGYFEDKPMIKVIEQPDKSIYDGMNQAVTYVTGDYVQFLNCGDYFYSKTVLEEVAEYINREHEKFVDDKKSAVKNEEENTVSRMSEPRKCIRDRKGVCLRESKFPVMIFYGNQYNQIQDTVVYSAPQINDFTCYRNVPCHQVCFYDYRLFEKRAYELKYKVRADYEHFLYSVYEEHAKGISMPLIVASYEGGGFSETKENRRQSAIEHKEITKKYLGAGKVLKYQMVMWLTLAPLRTWMAENPKMSGIYNRMKTGIYKVLKR